MRFGLYFDFDCKGEPPRVFIADRGGRGQCYVEILEEPTSPLGQHVRLSSGAWEWQGGYSWLPADWWAGPLARALLEFMNSGHLEV